MYDFMAASAEEHSAKCERQRRALAALPCTITVSRFLANRAAALLDLQIRVEDTLLVLKNTDIAPANTPECRSVILHLRSVLLLISAEVGTFAVAACYDIESAFGFMDSMYWSHAGFSPELPALSILNVALDSDYGFIFRFLDSLYCSHVGFSPVLPARSCGCQSRAVSYLFLMLITV
jgi:hypothetical protein